MIVGRAGGTTRIEMVFLAQLMTRRLGRVGITLGALWALSACDIDDSGRSGELGRGLFFYECDNNPDDAFCDRDALDREFPAAVAVGAHFKVDYEPENSTAYVDLVSGCLDCMERSADGFTMSAEGRAPLLAENSLGEIYDVLHIEAKAASALVMRVDGEGWPDGELLLIGGATHELGVTPQAADGTELGGALDYTWEIADESVVQLMSSGERNDVELRAVAAGQTTVTVTSGDLRLELPVNVKEAG